MEKNDSQKEGQHAVAAGLPPPPVTKERGQKEIETISGTATNKPGEDPAVRTDEKTEEWVKEAKVDNTTSG